MALLKRRFLDKSEDSKKEESQPQLELEIQPETFEPPVEPASEQSTGEPASEPAESGETQTAFEENAETGNAAKTVVKPRRRIVIKT